MFILMLVSQVILTKNFPESAEFRHRAFGLDDF